VGLLEAVSPPHQLGGLGKRCKSKLLQRAPGGALDIKFYVQKEMGGFPSTPCVQY